VAPPAQSNEQLPSAQVPIVQRAAPSQAEWQLIPSHCATSQTLPAEQVCQQPPLWQISSEQTASAPLQDWSQPPATQSN